MENSENNTHESGLKEIHSYVASVNEELSYKDEDSRFKGAYYRHMYTPTTPVTKRKTTTSIPSNTIELIKSQTIEIKKPEMIETETKMIKIKHKSKHIKTKSKTPIIIIPKRDTTISIPTSKFPTYGRNDSLTRQF